MKIITLTLLIAISFLFINCADNKAATNEDQIAPENRPTQTSTAAANDEEDILGEWELTLMVFDRNGNKNMEEDEKSTGVKGGTNYFKFNADETCLYSLTRKSRGRYTVTTKSNGKKELTLLVHNKYNDKSKPEWYKENAWEIYSLSGNELILFSVSGGKFDIYKKL